MSSGLPRSGATSSAETGFAPTWTRTLAVRAIVAGSRPASRQAASTLASSGGKPPALFPVCVNQTFQASA